MRLNRGVKAGGYRDGGDRKPTCGDRGFESPFLHQRVIYRRSAQGDRIGGASMQGFGPAIARGLRRCPPQVLPEEPTAVTPRGGKSQQWLRYPTKPHGRFSAGGAQ